MKYELIKLVVGVLFFGIISIIWYIKNKFIKYFGNSICELSNKFKKFLFIGI